MLNNSRVRSGFEDIFSANPDMAAGFDRVIEYHTVLDDSRFAFGEITPSSKAGCQRPSITCAGRNKENEKYGGEDGY